MKFANIALIVATVSSAAVKEGYECKKGVDTCTATSGAAGQCCNIMTTLLTTLDTTLCVDPSASPQ